MKRCLWAAIAVCAVANTSASNKPVVGQVSRHEGNALLGRPSLRRRPAVPHDEETEKPWQVQREVERIMKRLHRFGDATGAETGRLAKELERVEAELAAASGVDSRHKMGSPELQDEIRAVRASLCAEKELAQDQSLDCDAFMHNACPFQGALVAQGNNPAAAISAAKSSAAAAREAACQRFYIERHTASKKKKLQKASKEEPKEASEDGPQEASKAAPEVASNSTGAGKQAPLFGGKLERPLPSQGYNEYHNGTLVEHNDMKTVTSDWQKEFGAASGARDMYEICKEYPDNEWCRIHTYKDPGYFRSSAVRGCGRSTTGAVAIVALSGAVAWTMQQFVCVGIL